MKSSWTAMVVLSTGNLEVDEIDVKDLTISTVVFLIVVGSIALAFPENGFDTNGLSKDESRSRGKRILR